MTERQSFRHLFWHLIQRFEEGKETGFNILQGDTNMLTITTLLSALEDHYGFHLRSARRHLYASEMPSYEDAKQYVRKSIADGYLICEVMAPRSRS